MKDQSTSGIVHIVEDDPLVREATELILGARGFRCQTYSSATEYLKSLPTSETGCLILDVMMEGMNGLELESELEKRGSALPIIFLSGEGTISMAVEAVKRGAFEFLEKPVDADKLTKLVDTALAASRKRHEAETLLEKLTRREKEVFGLLASGMINKVIGAKLNISQGTVEYHRASVMRKLGAQGLEDLIKLHQKSSSWTVK